MDLSEEQKQTVTGWVGEGLGLSDVQVRLKSELDIALTYMEVRFLVDDLDLNLQDPVEEVKAETPDSDGSAVDANAELIGDGSGVSVEVDKIQRPGAVVSGSVTFSDGHNGTWHIDQMGRLSISPGTDGYKPSDEDMAEFQQVLQQELKSKGF